ncbi:MAG TPA: alkaline phosphatase family protein [Terracidiphilus sp.]|nr:alkaline phosphatase family protein [Terracidiphilus sp.]
MQKVCAASLVMLLAVGPLPAPMYAAGGHGGESLETATPIKHLVVIYQENVSFDHYFATYPYATNPAGEPPFHALPGTPSVNGLTHGLLTNNPNYLNAANNATLKSGAVSMAANPFRLDRSQAATADQDHNYTPEQMAFDGGLMDLFPLSVGTEGPPPSAPAAAETTALTMGYFDGNTVTALWNYAQHFAMSDNMYGTTFGPSTPGALEVISGQTNGVASNTVSVNNTTIVAGGGGSETLISDADPAGDVCASKSKNVYMNGSNIGDLLNAAGVSWGFFEGGFDLTITNSNDTTGCSRSTLSAVTGVTETDYIPHHQPFQYYTSTQNLAHTRPASVASIGEPNDSVAHNQYDIHDFFDAVKAGNFPAVAYLKAPGYEDGHAGYSDPLDEQNFIVNTINFLEQQPEWSSTAVIISYDDSDGWYDHQMSPIVNQSQTPADVLNGSGFCGTATPGLAGIDPTTTPNAQGRCGYGPRLVFMVISPWAKTNYVSHKIIDQSSVVRFIEDNWLGGQRLGGGSFDAIAGSINDMFDFSQPAWNQNRLFLNSSTGEPVNQFPGLPFGFPVR